jgi:hypothetical protein
MLRAGFHEIAATAASESLRMKKQEKERERPLF